MLEELRNDVRYAVRGLRRDRILTVAATLTLAVCIAANTTVLSLVNSVLVRPLPYPNSERIHWLTERMGPNQMEVGVGADYYSLRDENRAFDAIGAYDELTLNWSGVEKPEQLNAAQVTPSFFRVMGSQPVFGRYLAHGEEGADAPHVVVVSYSFWRSRLGSDPHIVGKTITLDRVANTVVGVMPQGFDYPRGTQVWRPLRMDERSQRPRSIMRPMRMVRIVALLKAGVTRQQLDTELLRLTRAIRNEYPKDFDTAGFLKGMRITATPLQQRITGNLRPALIVLTAAVALMLLIACVNVASLLLARSAARQREIAVRLALGSDRPRVVRQVLTESIALALPGGIAGMLIASFAVAALNHWKPLILENHPAITLDWTVLLFTFVVTLCTGLLFGMAPAAAVVRIDVQDALKSVGQTHSGSRRSLTLRRGLVTGELALSLVLLIGAGLLARSFVRLARTELGFPAERLLTLRLNLTGAPYNSGEALATFYDTLLGRLKQLPMVRAAAVSTDLPLSAGGFYSRTAYQIAGRTPVPMAQQPAINESVVSSDFFRAMGIPLKAGRTFDAQDSPRARDAIVVNEAFVRQVFAGENPVGRVVIAGPNDPRAHPPRWTIAGVVGNIRSGELGAEPEPLAYRCTCQGVNPFLSRMAVLVRTNGDPRAAIRAAEGQVYAVDRNQPVFDVRTMEERVADSLAPQRFNLFLLGTFAAIAIILAAIGIYGVMSYLAARRTREIGIRIAIGANREHVIRLVLGETAALTIAAIIGGLAGAGMLTRYLKSMLYGITTLDAVTFVVMPLVLAGVAFMASFTPAMRAARIDPMSALREE